MAENTLVDVYNPETGAKAQVFEGTLAFLTGYKRTPAQVARDGVEGQELLDAVAAIDAEKQAKADAAAEVAAAEAEPLPADEPTTTSSRRRSS